MFTFIKSLSLSLALMTMVAAHSDSKTTIVATIGPATASQEKLEGIIKAGVDFARINFSHGSHESNAALIDSVRNAEKVLGKHIPIIIDLQGPKYRIGQFQGGSAQLKAGDRFALDMNNEPGSDKRVQFNHAEIYSLLTKGDMIFLEDGKFILRTENVMPSSIQTTVVRGGTLIDRKGVNLPDLRAPVRALTPKDEADVKFAIEKLRPDYFALSFVQRADDIKKLRNVIGGHKIKVIAKIEKPMALKYIDEIAQEADVLMVARGDMGVEIGHEKVPVMQRKIIAAAKKHKKPVIVATEMMMSMVKNHQPTRAESSDVATAVYLNADSVMLSNETAVGEYPVETVTEMNKILEFTERNK